MPRVLAVDEVKKCTLIGSGALQVVMPIPTGWHAIDDGKRTLLFDTNSRAGNMQINFNLFELEPGSTPGAVS